MRFLQNGPSIPDKLLHRRDAGRVVFLCGAGVSVPSKMPDFVDLTSFVIDFFGPSEDSQLMQAFQPWLTDRSGSHTPLDQIFHMLHLEYGKEAVNRVVTQRLSVSQHNGSMGREHELIRRISSSKGGSPQVVTTNFDRLFEWGHEQDKLVWHSPPAFPDLTLEADLEGIVYLHGRVVEADSAIHPYVLSSADFGRAYLAEGWATQFIRNLLQRYTVVMVGYQAEDPPVKYLLQGLNHDGQYDRSNLYAFDRGAPEAIETKWRDRGVTAIAYADHRDLWETMEAWATRADNPRAWRASVVATTKRDPKELLAHQRGQVAHILRSVQGAKAFAEANPRPHPEWIGVMDPSVRCGPHSKGYGPDAETFDPAAWYGIDDDPPEAPQDSGSPQVQRDDVLAWREGDDNPVGRHRIGHHSAQDELTPPRLGHLVNWIAQSIDSPVLAWWAVRNRGLHPRVVERIGVQMERTTELHPVARHRWNLILESQRDLRNHRWDGEWFDLLRRIKTEGWTGGVFRQFERVSTPRLRVTPPSGLGGARPPRSSWDSVGLSDLGQWSVVLLKHLSDVPDIPNAVLPEVFRTLEKQLLAVAGLLADIGTYHLAAPSCYPEREGARLNHDEEPEGLARPIAWFLRLFDQLAGTRPNMASSFASNWPMAERFIFRKLKLYALNQPTLFDAEHAAQEVLSLDQEAFWSSSVAREILFLLEDRWRDFAPRIQSALLSRILDGPSDDAQGSQDEQWQRRSARAVGYARYLELRGCILPADSRKQLDGMLVATPTWTNERVDHLVAETGTLVRRIDLDDAPDVIQHLPARDVIARAMQDLRRDFGSFTHKRPFTGLVKANPRKALLALKLEGMKGDFPSAFWSALITDVSDDVSLRFRRVLLSRLARLPSSAVHELRHTLGRWLKQNLATTLGFDTNLAWALYDHVVASILDGGQEAVESALIEAMHGNNSSRPSRRTFMHALNGPVGLCAQALIAAVPADRHAADARIPDQIKRRFERLCAAPGDGADHAVSIMSQQLNWLLLVDPVWTRELLVPMLALNHERAEPAWSGLLHSPKAPSKSLVEMIKPILLNLFPWVEQRSWDRDVPLVAARWLGALRLFRPEALGGLSSRQMRASLRGMTDDTRTRLIFWLGRIGREDADAWVKHVLPFIGSDWPRERRYITTASVTAWVGLMEDTGDHFPAIYEAVKPFLTPVETANHVFHAFTRGDGREPATVKFPRTVLALVDSVTPHDVARMRSDISNTLQLIAEVEPSLAADPRYLRLIDIVDRT